jgi:hypothetical protein
MISPGKSARAAGKKARPGKKRDKESLPTPGFVTPANAGVQ